MSQFTVTQAPNSQINNVFQFQPLEKPRLKHRWSRERESTRQRAILWEDKRSYATSSEVIEAHESNVSVTKDCWGFEKKKKGNMHEQSSF